MSLFGRIGNDIAHPFGIGNGPVRTPAPQQQAQRQVIQTPAPGQQPQHFSQVAQQRIMARNPSMGAQQIARGPIYNHAPAIQVQQPSLMHQNVQALGLAGARTGVGLGQGVSGLVDLATPGTGTSRVSKGLNNAAVSIDKQAKKQGVNTGYKVLQAPLNVATFLGPGVATAATKIPELGAVTKGAAELSKLGAGGRIAGAALRGTASGANVVNAATATGMQLGTMAGKGQKVTPHTAVTTGLTNLAFGGGLSAGGQAGIEALHGAAKLPGVLAKGATKVPGATTKLAKNVVNIPESVAHEHLVATDPYYNTYHDQLTTQKQTFDRNAANGMAPGHPTQVQLQKSMSQLGAKTADMRQAVLDNAKLNVSSKLGLKPLNSEGKALVKEDGSVIPTIRKAVGKPVEAPATATPVPKRIVSSEDSIAPDSLASLKKEALKHDNPSIFATTVLRSDMPVPKDFIDFSRTNESDGRAKLESLYNQAHAEAKTGTAPSTKPALPKQPAVVPRRNPLPKVSGEKPVGVSSPKTTPNNMTADSYARTFGVGKAQAAKDIAEASKAPKTKPIPKQKPAPATAAENTARNPVKVNIPTVEAGNFEQARINPQLASHPVQFATGQLLSKAKRLGLDTSTFGKMVEGTIESSTQAEADAVKAYRDLTDRVHATSQSLGGNTPYVNNYFRHEWDLSDPEKRVEFNKMAEKLKTKGKADNPFAFEGLDRQPRVFKTIAQGEALGFKLKNQNLADEIKDYGSGSAHALRQQALSKALTEADMNAETKPHTFDLGGGKNVLLSDEGMKQAKGYAKNMASDNVGVKAYRKSNRGFKQILLSVSQFHPINISVLRASPTLAAEGHGLRAAKGIFDTFVAQASPKYSEKLQAAALRDGTIEDSARMGTPIKFGSDYKTEGQIGFGKGGLGEKAIFERAMPAEHIQMVKAAKQDLQEKGLSLDSPEAHALGTRINEIMGFVNTEARNLDKGTQRRLGDIFLAPQFTRSKWATNKAAVSTGGLAGSYARSAVVANAAASAFVAMGVGYALHQKSDNLNDLLLRAVFHPSVPTPLKDKKGNTIEFGLPATQSSEVLGLLGFSLKRGTDQHLHVDWKGGNVPSNVANYGRSRLAVVPANALKVATNTDYAGKPLYDPNATAKTKLEQGATTVSTGLLPIGGQGIAQTKLVKSHLPSGVQQVLNANTPGTNPMLKSAAASFGLTPRTDKTVGKGQQTTQYFDALNGASKGLNSQEKAALTMVTGSKKNPVTGKYDVAPTSDDSRAKATALLQNPKVIDHLIAMNQTLKKQGQAVDPLFTASKDQITKYYQYQAMPPGSADKTDWMNKNKDWYRPVADARNSFFNSLPAGDPNKPKSPIQYPSASPAVANLQSQYDTLTDSKAKGNFIADHPELLAQWNKQSQYTNKMRTAQGYAALKDSPQAAPALQKYMDSYNAADKATRKSIRNSNPTAYQSMIAYYDSVDLYNLNKQGAVNQLQGEPDQNSKQNKAIQGLARDIYQNADGTYGIVPAGWMDGLSNGSGSSGGYGSGSKGGKKSKGLTAISNSKVSYAGLSKANRGSYGKFKVGGSSKVGSSTVKLASYKAPKANVIKKPKGVLA